MRNFIFALVAAMAVVTIWQIVRPSSAINPFGQTPDEVWFKHGGCEGLLTYPNGAPSRKFALIDDEDYTAIDQTGVRYPMTDVTLGNDCVSEPQHAHDKVRLLHSLN